MKIMSDAGVVEGMSGEPAMRVDGIPFEEHKVILQQMIKIVTSD